jgi:hypothetical protein
MRENDGLYDSCCRRQEDEFHWAVDPTPDVIIVSVMWSVTLLSFATSRPRT